MIRMILICILGLFMLTGCDAKDTAPPESSSVVSAANKEEQDHFETALVSEANSQVSKTGETEATSSSQSVPESSKVVPSESDQPVVNPPSSQSSENNEVSQLDSDPPPDPELRQWMDTIKKEHGVLHGVIGTFSKSW